MLTLSVVRAHTNERRARTHKRAITQTHTRARTMSEVAWTPEEDSLLEQHVQSFNNNNIQWKELNLPGRTSSSARARWTRLRKSNKRARSTDERHNCQVVSFESSTLSCPNTPTPPSTPTPPNSPPPPPPQSSPEWVKKTARLIQTNVYDTGSIVEIVKNWAVLSNEIVNVKDFENIHFFPCLVENEHIKRVYDVYFALFKHITFVNSPIFPDWISKAAKLVKTEISNTDISLILYKWAELSNEIICKNDFEYIHDEALGVEKKHMAKVYSLYRCLFG